MITELTDNNFMRLLRQPGIVVVDCWAEWCGACKQFEQVYRRVAEKRSQHTFTKLDTENNKDLRSALEISHIPSLLLYRDGILLLKQPGNFDEEALNGIIDQAEALDMEIVRAETAKDGIETEADES